MPGLDFSNTSPVHAVTSQESLVLPVSDTNATAVSIALNNSTVQSYLTGGYTITRVHSGIVGINLISYQVTIVEIDTPQDLVGVNVDTTNQSIISIWSLPKREPIPTSVTTPSPTVLNNTSLRQDSHGCPPFLVNPHEFTCPREMQPRPETYTIADPDHPTQKEIDAIPVDFPGVDRITLINAALSDPCVKEFLRSGGVIEGITDQPRPLQNKTETVRWPPTLMADRWINYTDLRVFFDIDPSSGKVTRIWGVTL